MQHDIDKLDEYLTQMNILLETRIIPTLEKHNENLEQVKENIKMWELLKSPGVQDEPKEAPTWVPQPGRQTCSIPVPELTSRPMPAVQLTFTVPTLTARAPRIAAPARLPLPTLTSVQRPEAPYDS